MIPLKAPHFSFREDTDIFAYLSKITDPLTFSFDPLINSLNSIDELVKTSSSFSYIPIVLLIAFGCLIGLGAIFYPFIDLESSKSYPFFIDLKQNSEKTGSELHCAYSGVYEIGNWLIGITTGGILALLFFEVYYIQKYYPNDLSFPRLSLLQPSSGCPTAHHILFLRGSWRL